MTVAGARRLAVRAVLLGALLLGIAYVYGREDPPPTFITAPVERGTIFSSVKATGTVDAVMMVDVSSELSGRIANVLVSFNDTVKAGQPLAQIDPEIYVARADEAAAALIVAKATAQIQEAALERAKAVVASARTAQKVVEAQTNALQAKQAEAEKELGRKLQLARTGAVADRDVSQARALRDAGAADLRASLEQVNMKSEAVMIAEAELRMAAAHLENAQAAVEQKQAALDQAKLDIERTVLRAPIDGVIIKRDINPGQIVAVSLEAKTLFKIANDLSEMEVHGKIDEADVGRLKVGQTAHYTVDAYPDRTFTGRVQQIRKSPEVVQNVVTYTAIISAPNPELALLPGMTATLEIVVSDSGEVLKIPNQALRFHPGPASATFHQQAQAAPTSASGTSMTVWVIGSDSRPTPVQVSVGVSDHSGAQLLAGPLTEGERLIVGIGNSQARSGLLGIRLGF